ncbi:DUF6932 family protein [Streptomyces megasporus]|uniref:DUF6932 family protein n=1 Tax=Streptomyces megasporus TaxID=44060 RepID=UPI0004E2356C|nr:hypothetical protein [Streptomyces megasporus]
MLPRFDTRGFLPPGRYSVTMEEAETLLVSAPIFQDSATRRSLWNGLQDYLYRFVALEDEHADLLEGRSLVHRVWLGGSFVSTKPDPRNVDATLLIDEHAEKEIRGNRGSKWLTNAFKSRDQVQRNFGVAPVRVGYRPVAHVFRLNRIAEEDRKYFMERGIWDDWWQRCRLPDGSDPAPSRTSAVPARGYVEVRL